MNPGTPSGPPCPYCGAEHTTPKSQYKSRPRYHCNECGRLNKKNPGTPDTDTPTTSNHSGGKATIHVIYQLAKFYTIGERIELKTGGYIVTGRVVAVRDHNEATDLCLVDLEDSETMTVAEYVARQKHGQEDE